jgi:hypothetical protein
MSILPSRGPMNAEHLDSVGIDGCLHGENTRLSLIVHRNLERAMLPNYETSIEHTRS